MSSSEKSKAPKTKLKVRDPEKYYRNCYYGCIAGKWLSMATPLVAVVGANWNSYFPDPATTAKTSIGIALVAVVSAFAVYFEARRKKPDGSDKVVKPALGWGLATALIFLLSAVLDDALLICGAEFAGQAVATAFRIGEKRFSDERETRRKARITAEAINKVNKESGDGGTGTQAEETQVPVD